MRSQRASANRPPFAADASEDPRPCPPHRSVDSIDVIVLNWNGRDDTIACVRSLRRLPDADVRIVVVDNGSEDASIGAFAAAFPDLTVIDTGANLGYAGGNNAGIRHCLAHRPASFLLILNNDTIVDGDLLGPLIDAARRLPRAGIFGPRIHFADRPEVIWFAGALWNDQALAFRHVDIGRSEPVPRTDDRTDYITGCAMFVRREVVEQVGLLDERFFLTYEETDFCYRARAAGWSCAVVDEARLRHKVSASFGGAQSPLMTYFLTRNRLLFVRRHFGASSMLKVLVRLAGELLIPQLTAHPSPGDGFIRRLYWLLRDGALFRIECYRVADWKAKYAGVRDYVLRRLGDCPPDVRRLNAAWRSVGA